MSEIALKIKGMSCQHCVNRVAKALGEVPGVESVAVDLKKGRASVKGEPLDTAALAEAVKKAGYAAAPIES